MLKNCKPKPLQKCIPKALWRKTVATFCFCFILNCHTCNDFDCCFFIAQFTAISHTPNGNWFEKKTIKRKSCFECVNPIKGVHTLEQYIAEQYSVNNPPILLKYCEESWQYIADTFLIYCDHFTIYCPILTNILPDNILRSVCSPLWSRAEWNRMEDHQLINQQEIGYLLSSHTHHAIIRTTTTQQTRLELKN